MRSAPASVSARNTTQATTTASSVRIQSSPRQLRDAVRQAVADVQFQKVMEGAGQPIQYLDQAEFKVFFDKDAKKMADVVRQIGKVEEKK